ncbi:MAG: substrate-binding domain-containing protein [Verrucomicrobiota bacterium]
MNRFVVTCVLICVGFAAQSATNLPSASTLLLQDKSAIELTTGLSEYEDQPKLTGKLTSVGSGTVTMLINRWASEFATLYPKVELDIEGGGSAAHWPAFLEGKVDLVPMSRPLWADEITRFKSKFGYEPAQILVAQDAVGVYVNKSNPLPGLTLTQLDAIYSRETKRGGQRPEFWRDLGVGGTLAEARIIRVSLSEVHGTHLFFQDEVMLGADYRFGTRFERVSSSLAQAVGSEDAAIGFASVMFGTARTRFVPLQAADGRYLLPTYENTVSGSYPLVRPMRIVFHRKPDGSMNPVAREFLRFAVSQRGQRIIALAESYPITVAQQQQALQVIGDNPKQ